MSSADTFFRLFAFLTYVTAGFKKIAPGGGGSQARGYSEVFERRDRQYDMFTSIDRGVVGVAQLCSVCGFPDSF